MQEQPEVQKKAKKKSSDVVWINAWLQRNLDQIKKHTGLTVLDPKGGLGCGAFGCVYQTDDPRWVVKITRDETEGPLAQKVIDIRKEREGGAGFGPSRVLPGIVFYKAIFQARGTDAYIDKRWIRFRPFVIVRENVQPITDADVERMAWYEVEEIEHGERMPGLNILMKWAEKFHRPHTPEEMEQAVIEYNNWMDYLQDEFPLVIDSMRFLFDHPYDLMLQDVHAHNVGFSVVNWGPQYRPSGSVVIHDLGVTPTGDARPKFALLNPLHVLRMKR